MKKSMLLSFVIILIFALTLNAEAQKKPKITFVELSSVSCIPCKKMQPIMKNIEKKYGDQIKSCLS